MKSRAVRIQFIWSHRENMCWEVSWTLFQWEQVEQSVSTGRSEDRPNWRQSSPTWLVY